MSWQASVFNMIFRLQKPGLKKKNFSQAKESMQATMARAEQAFKLPDYATLSHETINGVPCEWLSTGANQRGVVLYFHGGAFMVGSPPAAHRELAWRLSAAADMKVLLVDYRLTPEHIFPAALDDGLTVYRWLLDNGYIADHIAFAGDSAGGNMTLAVMLLAQQNNLPLPAAGVCLSPWADLTHVGDSIVSNEKKDPMLPVNILINAAQVYAGDKLLDDPLISPVFADFTGFPPLQVFAGSTEILLSDAQRIAENARAKNVEVEFKAWHKQAHAFPVMAQFLPEARQAITEMGKFLTTKIGTL
ncbi:alpha/beta hydrolase [Oceanicoccus sp. KOV_DT_Chl]|uniref:alpha/beta hydrolase n=1 Tax=Oceanicoccus sp. KOV_DT_Chl TaxID=1904639 RepID=UPI000C79A4E1|nr:alpha/beta hydrolase [Oceanicoccus sp. KOV_DT_Chl]